MKIALDLRPLSMAAKKSRGHGRNLPDLVRAFARVSDSERFILLLAPGQEFEPPSARFELVRLAWEYGDISRSHWWSESRRTGRFLAELDPDVYHVPDLYIPRRWSGPKVVTVHDYIELPLFGSVKLFGQRYDWRWNLAFRWRYRWTWWSLRHAAVVATNSMTTADRVRVRFPALAAKIRAIPWGLDPFWFDTPANNTSIVRQLDLSRPVILHVGGLEARKNPTGVLETFRKIREEYPAATLALAGPSFGPHPELSGVRVLGRVSDDELRSLYREADCLLFPSFEEGYGVPVAEALASGCPVVTSRGIATEEIAGGHAVLVNPWDREEIVAAVKTVLMSGRKAPVCTVGTADETAIAYLEAYRAAVKISGTGIAR